MAALEGAVALEKVNHLAVAVAEHLHLNMARPGDIGLQQDAVIAKGAGGFALGRAERRGEIAGALDLAHALAAAPGHGLDQHRIADLLGLGGEMGGVLVFAVIARRHRHPGLDHQGLGRILQPHGADGRRRRSDPGQARAHHRFGEVGVLRQEAIAGMDGVGAAGPGRLQHGGDIEIALPGRRRPQAHGLVGFAHMRGLGVGVGIDRHGGQAHLAGGAEDPPCDLAAVGDQEGRDHSDQRGLRFSRKARTPSCPSSLTRTRAMTLAVSSIRP